MLRSWSASIKEQRNVLGMMVTLVDEKEKTLEVSKETLIGFGQGIKGTEMMVTGTLVAVDKL